MFLCRGSLTVNSIPATTLTATIQRWQRRCFRDKPTNAIFFFSYNALQWRVSMYFYLPDCLLNICTCKNTCSKIWVAPQSLKTLDLPWNWNMWLVQLSTIKFSIENLDIPLGQCECNVRFEAERWSQEGFPGSCSLLISQPLHVF